MTYFGSVSGCVANPPVGGRISLFCRHVASSHIRCRLFFLLCDMVSNFRFKSHFSGVIRKVSVTPQDPMVILRIQEEICDLIFEGCNRSNRRCSESLFVSNFRYPLEIRGSSSNFEF